MAKKLSPGLQTKNQQQTHDPTQGQKETKGPTQRPTQGPSQGLLMLSFVGMQILLCRWIDLLKYYVHAW
jgi:hypothetical protein